jgi:hypothetical protein
MRWCKWLCTVLLAAAVVVATSTPLAADAAPSSGFQLVKTVSGGIWSIVSPAPGEVWVAKGATLEHYVDGKWTEMPSPGTAGDVLSATASNDVWLTGESGLNHFDGTGWQLVPIPAGPEGEQMRVVAVTDVPGPGVYVAFRATRWQFGYYDGSTWTMLGSPVDVNGSDFESISEMAFVDGTLIVLAVVSRGGSQQLVKYENGAWTTAISVGYYVCCTFTKWSYDWVVNSPTDIWLYGDHHSAGVGDGTVDVHRPWCGHFTGESVIESCVYGTGVAGTEPGTGITAATKLANGQHLVGSNNQFDLLTQPNVQTQVSVPRKLAPFSVVDMTTEPGTNIVWAATWSSTGSYSILRYGVSTKKEEVGALSGESLKGGAEPRNDIT